MAILFQSLIIDLLVGFLTFCLIIYWFFTKNFNYWLNRNVPFLKPDFLFGNMKDQFLVRQSSAEMGLDIYNKLKDHKIAGIWMINIPILVVNDPEIIKRFLVKDFDHFHDRGLPVNEKTDPLSATLFNLSSTTWRTLRAKLTPTFTSGKMKLMFPLMRECALEFADFVNQEAKITKDLEFRELFAKMTTDIIGTCAFGMQFNSMKNPNSEFRTMGRKFFTPSRLEMIGQLIYHFFPKLGQILKIRFPPQDISDFFINAVRETIDYREKNNIRRDDFLQLLIELKNKRKIEDGEHDNLISAEGLASERDVNEFELTDTLLAAQTFLFFAAGFETSSTTMSFALHELVVNSNIKQKLRDEIDRVLEEHGGELTYESIRKMEYLDKVINETLRKYPPLPNLIRECTKSYREPDTNIVVEKGTLVHIPIFPLHRDPQYYPDPERFDPERFSEEQKSKRHNYVYLPFGEGPRICIGMRFGLMQVKLGLAALLSRFDLDVCDRTPQPLILDPKSFLLSAKGGVWARVTPRQHVVLTSKPRRDKED